MIDRIVVWALTLPYRVREERGQDLVEYALITGGVGLLLITITLAFTGVVEDWWEAAATEFGRITP
jgi:Flp pilus assembly pilin Flp